MTSYVSFSEAKTLGAKWLAQNPAALEIEFTVRCGNTVFSVWITRDGTAYDKPIDERKGRAS